MIFHGGEYRRYKNSDKEFPPENKRRQRIISHERFSDKTNITNPLTVLQHHECRKLTTYLAKKCPYRGDEQFARYAVF
jgi:hypothetical protein